MSGEQGFVRLALGAKLWLGSRSRSVLFTLECELGILAVIVEAAISHWLAWPLSVTMLLYLLLVAATALLFGFWQAGIVSLSAVVVLGLSTLRHPEVMQLEDQGSYIALTAFLLVALVVGWLSARVAGDARNAEHRTEQLRAKVLKSLAQAYQTPLTAILAASGGLSQLGPLSEPQADLVALIDEQACLLSDTTIQLLAAARLDTDQMAVHAQPVSVEPLLDDVVANLRPHLAKMNIAIDLEDEDLTVCCDRVLMLMLIRNLIDNASNYSTLGSTITIRAAHIKSEVVFSVHTVDPATSQADLAGKHNRHVSSTSCANRTATTGIGFQIAKRVAELHGGGAWVTGEEAGRTTFFAAIPALI